MVGWVGAITLDFDLQMKKCEFHGPPPETENGATGTDSCFLNLVGVPFIGSMGRGNGGEALNRPLLRKWPL